MTKANVPLQRRAGLNIGIEPDFSVYLQDAGGKEKALNTPVGSETVILECPEGVARTPLSMGENSGVIANPTAIDFNYTVFFRDELGNDAALTGVQTLAGNSNDAFVYHDGRLQDTSFTLTPGQKIVIKSVAAPPPP